MILKKKYWRLKKSDYFDKVLFMYDQQKIETRSHIKQGSDLLSKNVKKV